MTPNLAVTGNSDHSALFISPMEDLDQHPTSSQMSHRESTVVTALNTSFAHQPYLRHQAERRLYIAHHAEDEQITVASINLPRHLMKK